MKFYEDFKIHKIHGMYMNYKSLDIMKCYDILRKISSSMNVFEVMKLWITFCSLAQLVQLCDLISATQIKAWAFYLSGAVSSSSYASSCTSSQP